jgi:peptidoglycan hydrolase-like protein with peptidoglycan-binding domain
MTAAEPHLALGDTGEWVLRLQTRLHALGLFAETLDGSFGEATLAAVVRLQEQDGIPADGAAGEQTWAALGRAEQQAGLPDPFADSTGAADPSAVDASVTPVGTLSEDHQWQWDGEQWQPKSGVAADPHSDQTGGQVSTDGQWVWDGEQWQPAS